MTTPQNARTVGTVYLVGAGPGDPDLLTVKALRLLQSCDVVVFDRLVSQEILDLVPQGVSRIYVGKALSRHHMPQEEINATLVALARSGRSVVRLKGGDPFIFGRGSEEAMTLAEADIPFEVVPGITAASGCATYAGFPLTHRGMASGVRYITGHFRAGEEDRDHDWSKLADCDTTLVFYMGLTNLDRIVEQLTAHGLPASTPAAAIQDGTTAGQRAVIGTLADLAGKVQDAGLRAPAVVIIGRVVGLAETLAWRQTAPLVKDDRAWTEAPDEQAATDAAATG